MPTPIVKVKSMLELCGESAKANTNDAVRQLLELQSASETQQQIADLFVPIDAAITDVEKRQDTTEMLVATMSGDIATMALDAYNLDLSINAQIDELFNTTTTTAVSGAYALPAGAQGFITIVVNGENKKIAYFG